MKNLKGPFREGEIEQCRSAMTVGSEPTVDEIFVFVGKTLVARDFATVSFIRGLGIMCQDVYDALEPHKQVCLQGAVANLFVKSAEDIARIRAERDHHCKVGEDRKLPPALPLQLIIMSPCEIIDVLQRQRDRMETTRVPQDIENIHDEFRAFKNEIRNQNCLPPSACATQGSTFATAWGSLRARFPPLHSFCGGLETVLPGTSFAEADLCIINWVYNDCRKSLTEFSLEGVLQCKEFEKLHKIELAFSG
jgi:hypothetical protein